jgi:hypothetical protein
MAKQDAMAIADISLFDIEATTQKVEYNLNSTNATILNYSYTSPATPLIVSITQVLEVDTSPSTSP